MYLQTYVYRRIKVSGHVFEGKALLLYRYPLRIL